jgi:hypothetical protein
VRLLKKQPASSAVKPEWIPRSSVAIDDMQARPSLPVQSPEARAGAVRAQRLLPLAKNLVIEALKQLVIDYGFQNSRGLDVKVAQGIERVQAVSPFDLMWSRATMRQCFLAGPTRSRLALSFSQACDPMKE